jgi:hypothetical protein
MSRYITYDIGQFKWNATDKTFYGEAMWLYPDNTNTIECFPNGKQEFHIVNNKTNQSRKFTFLQEDTWEDELGSKCKIWQYETEDGIMCNIMIGYLNDYMGYENIDYITL